MRSRVVGSIFCAALAACACVSAARAQTAQAQQPPDGRGVRESRVPLADAATAYDIGGRVAVAARLRTTPLAGAVDAPVRNVLLVVENRGGVFYNYASGWATFYDGAGVRCGEGLWKVEAFAPGESAEVDTPGLRLTCAPATWRVTALNLLTRTTDVAKPAEQAAPPTGATQATPATPAQTAATPAGGEAPMRLEINVNGKTLPLQLDNPLDVIVGKERVLIVVRRAP
ncbi:MAG: hypothetical protein LC785_13810 [Acidobacteria bacterium]|nr:hypothetical protein [Acidobacteriota bacterium]MCA1642990.1 hypothetical protein [Acidobacteriota bacterium]